MKGKKIVSFLFCLLSLKSYSYMNVSPLIFDKRIDNGGEVQEYYVTNALSHKTSYRIYLEKGNENDMSEWIEYYPRNLNLEAGETGKVKLYIEAPENTKDGEYTAILGVKEVNTPNVERGGNLSIYTNLKIELAGFVGDLKPQIEVEDIKVENNQLSMKIINKGEIRTKLEVFLENSKESEKYIGSIRLLKGYEKIFLTKISTEIKKGSKVCLRSLNGELIKEIEMKGEK